MSIGWRSYSLASVSTTSISSLKTGVVLLASEWHSRVSLSERCLPFHGLVIARYPERFLRIAVANTALPVGGKENDGFAGNNAFKLWAGVISQKIPSWGPLFETGCVRRLSDAEKNAYEAPFPSEPYMAASREFPRMVPQFDAHAGVEENKGAWRRVFDRWHKPLLTLFSDQDAVSRGGEKVWQERVPGAKGQPHTMIQGGGHFLQEDTPEELVRHLLAFARAPLTAKL
eukprot:TRINITY_DN28270_c0_g1_i2.p1 TRINITY_DN28270_c0_g1~~TRINITY_DN28270_c0_g1_i2.p1  ORF type:complete len:229 (-),score=30.82 TRINITY_DN28270_c0_g1_i2:205-891(-)